MKWVLLKNRLPNFHKPENKSYFVFIWFVDFKNNVHLGECLITKHGIHDYFINSNQVNPETIKAWAYFEIPKYTEYKENINET